MPALGVGAPVARAALALGLVLVGGCREAQPPAEPPVRLAIVAAEMATVVERSLSFRAVGYDRQGREVAVGPVGWSVSNTLGQIDANGLFLPGAQRADGFVHARLAEPRLVDSVSIHVALPGDVRWVYAAPVGRRFNEVGSFALGPDGTVYVLEDIERGAPQVSALTALSARGERRWSLELWGISADYPVVSPAGPIVVAGRRIYLISPAGGILWQASANETFSDFASSAVTDSRFVAAVGFDAFAYSIKGPELLWRAPRAPLGDWLVPPSIDGAGRVYLKHTEDTLFVIRLSDGTVLRTVQDPDSLVDKRVFGVGTVPVGSRFYLPTASRLAAYDSSGAPLWLTGRTGRGVSEPAVAPNGDLYVQTGGGALPGLWALRPDGTERWRLFRIQRRWPWYGGPALARGGTIYAAGEDGFWAVDSTGSVIWSFRADSAGAPQAFIGAPAIAPDGTVYSYTSTHLYAFWGPRPPEPNSPWPMWRHDAQRTGWAR